MTFDEFRASRVWYDDLGEGFPDEAYSEEEGYIPLKGFSPTGFRVIKVKMVDGRPPGGWCYLDEYYIEDAPLDYYCLHLDDKIEYCTDLEALEHKLYAFACRYGDA